MKKKRLMTTLDTVKMGYSITAMTTLVSRSVKVKKSALRNGAVFLFFLRVLVHHLGHGPQDMFLDNG